MASLVRSGVALHRPQTFAVSSFCARSCCLVRHVVSFGQRDAPISGRFEPRAAFLGRNIALREVKAYRREMPPRFGTWQAITSRVAAASESRRAASLPRLAA